MNRVKIVFSCEEMVIYTTFNIVNIRKMWEKKGKIRRTRSMTKKRSSEIFTLKMEIFPEIGPRKNFLVPPKFGARSPPMDIDIYGQTYRQSQMHWRRLDAEQTISRIRPT